MSKRKQRHEEHVNLERWLVSYADFVTLLFIVFLILFSMSAVDAQK
ncbi:flagellar motor protein MotB, partial [Acinetobacter baumannii]